jgi:two-component system NtrC family response regulator
VRVISATNRDLDAMLADGTFRGDLYHRIADWDVTVPSLRERRADIPNLAAHFLGREAQRRGVRVAGISRAALDALRAAPWPGNIRQLEREMARVVLFLEDGQLLERSHLKEGVLRDDGTTPVAGLRGQLEQAERAAIVRALAACGGDVTAAAETLDIGRSTLYRRMRELGIEA